MKKQLNGCIVCNKLYSRPLHYPSHSDLPNDDESKPFNSVGVDYLGPLLVLPVFLATNKMHKVHVALYTCAATRGIWLDIVEDLSAHSFVNSLRRFISDRGVPKLIVSDNGSAFTATETQSCVANKLICR